MREILFRAKSDGLKSKWVYGYYAREAFDDGVDHIISDGIYRGTRDSAVTETYSIFPETLGQYSGEKDIYGERIFEGDILIERIRTRAKKDGLPGYRVRKYIVRCNTLTFYLEAIGAQGRPSRCLDRCEVIGNIHDNPELLTKGGT